MLLVQKFSKGRLSSAAVQLFNGRFLMEETFVPFQGIKNDLKGRLLCYKQDWTGGLNAGFRYLLQHGLIIFVMELYYRIDDKESGIFYCEHKYLLVLSLITAKFYSTWIFFLSFSLLCKNNYNLKFIS